ncbi:MAG: right-handed parallel beta-helix repeat-containing protein [Bryobacterales bacterium]|nr:right-handed parallel beta-helix repeat-containing protein [Bryobacterales bacterium]
MDFNRYIFAKVNDTVIAAPSGNVILFLALVCVSFYAQPGAAQTAPACLPGNGAFTACIYSGTAFNKLVLQRQDPQISFNWSWGAPYSGGPADQFSVRWEGDFNFNAGNYRFVMRADDGARLYVDGRVVIDKWTGAQPWDTYDVVLALMAGTHRIKVEHYETWGPASIRLFWQPDTGFRDFYVSPSGNDDNDGRSPESAWRSIGKVTFSKFQGGDRILFEGGKSFQGSIYFGGDDTGSAAKPIVVTSYGAGRATIRAGLLVGLLAYNTAGIEVRNLSFVGDPGNGVDGVQFFQNLPGNVKLPYIRIDSVETSGFGSAGVSIYSWAGTSGYEDVKLTNISAHDNLIAGIQVGGYLDVNLISYAHRNVYIADCQMYRNTGLAYHWRDTGFGLLLASTEGAVVERNVAHDNGEKSTTWAGPMGIFIWESTDVLVQFNEVHHTRTSGGDGGGIDLDGGVTNSVVQYNYTHDNDGAGLNMAQYAEVRNVFANNTLRYNISQNDGRKSIAWSGIAVWNASGAMRDCHIYNNTVFGTPNGNGMYQALMIVSPTTNFTVRNNVFVTTGGMGQVAVVAGQTNLVFQGNSYWGSGSPLRLGWGSTSSSTLAGFRKASGQELVNGMPSGLEVDPLLTAPGTGITINDPRLLAAFKAYAPLPGSPLINRGLSLASFGINPGLYDFAGTAVPQAGAFDVGALEADTFSALR